MVYGVDRSDRDQAFSSAVILSEAKDLLLYAGIGPSPAEKQIPRGVYPEQRRRGSE